VPHLPSTFRRLLEPLDRRLVSAMVERHDGNHGVGNRPSAWTCQRHLKTLLFAQFAGLNSLREIEQGLAAQPHALYHLDLHAPRRSTLSDALAKRPCDVFRDLCGKFIGILGRSLRAEGEAVIRLLDSSPIPLRDKRFTWAQADPRYPGLKLHVLHDPRAVHPVHFAVTAANVSDVRQGRTLTLHAGSTYVFDKGYTDYNWWHDIAQAGAFFVTRLKSNAHRRLVRPRAAVGEAILADTSLRIGHRKPRGGATNALYDTDLREVVVARAGKAPLHLVTNDHSRSAEEIAALYKERWQIELFFKWIKQNLKIKAFIGRSENAVKTQIYIAILAFLLLRLFHTTFASSHHGSAKDVLARLKVALFSTFILNTQRRQRTSHPDQLNLTLQNV